MQDIEQLLKDCARLFPKQEKATFSQDRYKILSCLGQGSFGKVYRAYDNFLRRFVAIKVLCNVFDEKTLQRFIREAKLTAQLCHEKIVSVYDFQKIEGNHAIIMQCISGQSLAQKMKAGNISLSQSCQIILDILEGIGYAHKKNMIHRDLKPSNILFDQDNRLHIVDFGLAKILSNPDNISSYGTILGTPFYMSPEQAQGLSNSIDAQSDLYSVGAIFYEILTGKKPFSGENFWVILEKIKNEPLVSPKKWNPNISDTLEKICKKALEKDKKNRYQTAEQMAFDIQSFWNQKQEIQSWKKIALCVFLILIPIVLLFFPIFWHYSQNRPKQNPFPKIQLQTPTSFPTEKKLPNHEPREGKNQGKNFFKKIDKNNDNKIQPEEWKCKLWEFIWWDKNHDGIINKKEWQEFLKYSHHRQKNSSKK